MLSQFHQVLSAQKIAQYFRYDYTASCALFRHYCLTLHRYPIHRRFWVLDRRVGLCTDVVWVGSRQATKVIVLISGTHGVEGYCGSAIQSFLLHSLEQEWLVLSADCALLVIHALNPWGMYWARRCDQNGVDLNRNFINFPMLPDVDPDYAKVLACLELTTLDARHDALDKLAKEWGSRTFEQVLSGGQYHCEWAPFYGGKSPSFANQVIEEVIDYWQLQERTLVVLDIHTGLGPSGYGEIISDHVPGSQGSIFASQIFADFVAETEKGESSSVPKLGLMDYRWHQLMAETGCFVTLEFGTRGTSALFGLLVEEHLFWRQSELIDMNDIVYRKYRQAMLDHFCPNQSLWQQAVLFKGWQLVQHIASVPTDGSN